MSYKNARQLLGIEDSETAAGALCGYQSEPTVTGPYMLMEPL